MKIYLACGLTHVPRIHFSEYADFLHRTAAALTAMPAGHEVKYALVNSDPQLASKPIEERARLCYRWDRTMVEEADLIIAEASFASIGLGIEMQIAQAQGTPIIVCFRDYGDNRAEPLEYVNPDSTHHHLQVGDGYVSLMALGIPEVVKVLRYSNSEQGIGKLLDEVALLTKP